MDSCRRESSEGSGEERTQTIGIVRMNEIDIACDFRKLVVKVIRQHYVPRAYLSAWGHPTRSGKSFLIWCKRRSCSDVQEVEAMSIAQRRYMYAYPQLGLEEQSVLIAYINAKPIHIKNFLARLYEPALVMPLYLRLLQGERSVVLSSQIDVLVKSGLFDELYMRILVGLRRDVEMNGIDICNAIADVKTICNNGFEAWMTTLEGRFYPMLDKARNGDLSFFDDQDSRAAVIYYFFVQMLRTMRFNKLLNEMPWQKYPNLQEIFRHGMAFEVATMNASEWKKYELLLIENHSNLPFVTGDQPLVNLDGNEDSPYFDLYFPICPSRALLFIERGRIDAVYSHLKNVTEREAHELNRKVAMVCEEQLYSNSKNSLQVGRYL